MGKHRFRKKELETIEEPYRDIVKQKDPIQFIDLLCFSHYVAGQFGNKIPVEQARKTFSLWLTKYDEDKPATTPINPKERGIRE